MADSPERKVPSADYRILGVNPDHSRSVLMTGMPLDEAEAARDEILKTDEYLWIWIERDPPTAQ